VKNWHILIMGRKFYIICFLLNPDVPHLSNKRSGD
jgi:hypothetical protein